MASDNLWKPVIGTNFYRIRFNREKEPVFQNSTYSLEFLEFSGGTPKLEPKSLLNGKRLA